MTPAARMVVLGRRPYVAGTLGLITKTSDGSVGQTYTLTPAWTNVQWYRDIPWLRRRTLIPGATGSSYVATSSDIGYRLTAIGSGGIATSYEVVLAAPILFEAFDSTTGWASGTLSIDATRQAQGTGALAVQGVGVSGSISTTKATIAGTFDPGTFGTVSYYVDTGDDPTFQHWASLDLRFGRGGTYYTQAGKTGISGLNDNNLNGRWNSFNVAEVATLPTLGSGSMQLRVVSGPTAPHAGKLRYDACLINSGGRPTIIPTFDDCCIEALTVAAPILAAAGIRASMYVVPGYLGTAGRLTLAELLTLKNTYGWDMQANGSYADTSLTASADMAAAMADIASVKQFLIDNGLNTSDNIRHMCYPNGAQRIAPTVVQVAAVTCNGTTSVTGTFTGVTNGMAVAGYQVPAGTTVVSGAGTGTLVLSNAVPSQTIPMSFTDQSGAFSTGKLQTALRAAGWKSGRGTTSGTFPTRFGPGPQGWYRWLTLPGNSGSLQTAAQMIADADVTLLRGDTQIRYFHMIADSGSGLRTGVQDFTDIVAYWKTKKDAGLLDVPTLADWYARDGASACPV